MLYTLFSFYAVGPLATYKEAPSFSEIVTLNAGLELGGHFHPPDCRARHRVAVIVPYRDREEHLRILVHNLHPILIRQQLDYAIFVVELVSFWWIALDSVLVLGLLR